MAKQLGVSEAALAGLADPERFPFPPDESAALRLADAMTRHGAEVTDGLFEEMRRHFDEAQIVELTCVIGLFNYFNRFNNALRMPITLADTGLLLARIRSRLTGAAPALEDALRIIADGRRLARLAIYRGAGAAGLLVAAVGEAPAHPPRPDPAAGCEIAEPITGEGDRQAGLLLASAADQRHLDIEDHDLLRQVAALLGPVLGERPGSTGG